MAGIDGLIAERHTTSGGEKWDRLTIRLDSRVGDDTFKMEVNGDARRQHVSDTADDRRRDRNAGADLAEAESWRRVFGEGPIDAPRSVASPRAHMREVTKISTTYLSGGIRNSLRWARAFCCWTRTN
jgi:hypothetical protein